MAMHFIFWENRLNSGEITGVVNKNSTACEESSPEIFIWITIYGIYIYMCDLYMENRLGTNFLCGLRLALTYATENSEMSVGERSLMYTWRVAIWRGTTQGWHPMARGLLHR